MGLTPARSPEDCRLGAKALAQSAAVTNTNTGGVDALLLKTQKWEKQTNGADFPEANCTR